VICTAQDDEVVLHFRKRIDTIENLIDEFEDKIEKCDTRGLIDTAIDIDDKISFASIAIKDRKAPVIFQDKLNGLRARFGDVKDLFEKKCRCMIK